MQMQADVQKRIQESEKKLREIPHFGCQQKVTVTILCKVEAHRILILLSVCTLRLWCMLYSRRTERSLRSWSRT